MNVFISLPLNFAPAVPFDSASGFRILYNRQIEVGNDQVGGEGNVSDSGSKLMSARLTARSGLFKIICPHISQAYPATAALDTFVSNHFTPPSTAFSHPVLS